MSLFITQKRLNTQKRFTEMYYRQIFFKKRLFNGIEWLAKVNGASGKEFANFLIIPGMTSFMGENIKLYIKESITGRQRIITN